MTTMTSRGGSPLIRILALAGPMRGRLLLAALAGAAATGSGIALLAVSGYLLARASEHPPLVAVSIAVVAVRALGISRGVFRYCERLTSHDVAFRVLADVRVRIYQRLERLAPAGLVAFRSGDLLSRLVSDVDATQDLFIRGIAPPLTAALAGGGAVVAAIAIFAPSGLLLAAGLLLAGVAVPVLAAWTARQAAAQSAPARGALGALLTDVFHGAADAHALGAQDELLTRAGAADLELASLDRRTAAASGLGSGLTSLAAGATLWAVLLAGVAATGSGALSRVPLAVITLTVLAAFEAVTTLPAAAIQLSRTRVSAARITAVLDAPDPVREPEAARPVPPGPLDIRMTGVRVRYKTAGPMALDGVDLDLPAGKRVAIIGPTGAGKSTIAAVLLRFQEYCGGRVTVNGADLRSFSSDEIRKRIGGCPQDPHIFDTTIAANLRLARPGATDAELADVAARVRLLDWISSLPDGFATRVGMHGGTLSGGERQRLALARALLADPAVLVLDEPTAHLDATNARALMADVFATTGSRSLLVITHDLADVREFDEILVLRHGKVVQRGTHDHLIGQQGPYRELSLCG